MTTDTPTGPPTFIPVAIPRGGLVGRFRGALPNHGSMGYRLAGELWGAAASGPDAGLLAFAYLYRRFGPPAWVHDAYKEIGAYCLTTPDPEVFLVLRCAADGIAFGVAYLTSEQIAEQAHKFDIEHEIDILQWLAGQVAVERPDLVTKRDEAGEPSELSPEGWEIVHRRRWDPAPDQWGPLSWSGRAAAALAERPPEEGRPTSTRAELVQRVRGALRTTMQALLEPVGVRDVVINILGRVVEAPEEVQADG